MTMTMTGARCARVEAGAAGETDKGEGDPIEAPSLFLRVGLLSMASASTSVPSAAITCMCGVFMASYAWRTTPVESNRRSRDSCSVCPLGATASAARTGSEWKHASSF
jgi:hypothetical protein